MNRHAKAKIFHIAFGVIFLCTFVDAESGRARAYRAIGKTTLANADEASAKRIEADDWNQMINR